MKKHSFSPLPERNDSRKFVLMMSRNYDPEADRLAGILFSKGINYVRINLDSISENLRLTCSINGGTETKNSLVADGEDLDTSRIGAVWLHHYDLSEINFSGNVLARKFAHEQWSDALYSFERCLHCAWINEPFATVHGSNHVEQLSVAKSLGFNIPATLITNDPKSAREFYHSYGGNVIVKALHHHRVETMGQVFQMYSRKIMDSDLEKLDDLIYAPCILQERLQKKSDIRVTVVGERVFAAEIDSPIVGASRDDWHRCSQQEITIRAMASKLPDLLEEQCIQIIKTLGLRYGAIDFVRNEIDNSFTFLEVNPTGDWIWIERRTNQEITRAVADLIESLI